MEVTGFQGNPDLNSIEGLRMNTDLQETGSFECSNTMFNKIQEKIKIAQLIDEAGLPWIKNSSGGGPFGIPATPQDIKLLFDTVSSKCKVKASGKVNSFEKMVSLFDAGAVLVGTSSGIEILNRTQGTTMNY